jgi:hypothetical protein
MGKNYRLALDRRKFTFAEHIWMPCIHILLLGQLPSFLISQPPVDVDIQPICIIRTPEQETDRGNKKPIEREQARTPSDMLHFFLIRIARTHKEEEPTTPV